MAGHNLHRAIPPIASEAPQVQAVPSCKVPVQGVWIRVSSPFCGLLHVWEGGGKRRVFAIGNYVKQRLLMLKPYYDWLMSILRRLPTDGTFC